MDKFTAYIYLIIFIKLCFILLAITHIYLKVKGEENSDVDKNIVYWKERTEFVFVFLMAFLLIYLFNPRRPNAVIGGETKILLFLFGFILLITAKWNIFIHEAKWFQNVQKIIGKNN